MGIIGDTKATLERVRIYGNQMKNLLSRHEIHSIDDLQRVAKDSSFQNEVTALWAGIIRTESAKTMLFIVLSTIAIAMGGVGIAAGGGAIGVPLLAILAPAGYFAGQELDSVGYTKAVVDMFEELLHKVQELDSERYTEAVVDKFKKLLENAQELDCEGYTKAAIERFKELLHKAQEIDPKRYSEAVIDRVKKLFGKTEDASP
jgi:ABC-type multidrug transport system fused ATPase/permease subunit